MSDKYDAIRALVTDKNLFSDDQLGEIIDAALEITNVMIDEMDVRLYGSIQRRDA